MQVIPQENKKLKVNSQIMEFVSCFNEYFKSCTKYTQFFFSTKQKIIQANHFRLENFSENNFNACCLYIYVLILIESKYARNSATIRETRRYIVIKKSYDCNYNRQFLIFLNSGFYLIWAYFKNENETRFNWLDVLLLLF